MAAAHQHTGKEQHREALTATCSAKVCTALTIAMQVDVRVFQNVLIEPVGSEELRIAANNLSFTLRGIGEENEALHYA